ncbi:MAG: hypothetical protein LRZ93_03395, partial [Clostridiales bacterium]|nr:hypothetical protein [Clostridiales bacterium]
LTIVFFSLTSYIVGYYTYPSINKNSDFIELNHESSLLDLENADQMENNNEKEEAAKENYQLASQNTISINEETKIVFRQKYTICNSIIEESKPIFAWIGLSEKKLRERIMNSHPDWEILKFSSVEVVLYKETNHVRPNYYYVTQENGYIIVYRYDETRGATAADKTNVLITTLPQIDQDLIKGGILLKSK